MINTHQRHITTIRNTFLGKYQQSLYNYQIGPKHTYWHRQTGADKLAQTNSQQIYTNKGLVDTTLSTETLQPRYRTKGHINSFFTSAIRLWNNISSYASAASLLTLSSSN